MALLLGAIVLWIAAGSSHQPSPQAPISTSASTRTIQDLAGRTVVLPERIERFVLMRGMGLYDLAALLGDRLPEIMVGWDSSLESSDRDAYDKFVSRFPKLKEIPLLGDSLKNGVSAEAVLALKPDVVIGGTYMIGQAQCLEQLERAGVPIVYLSSDDPLRDPQLGITVLGEVFGKQQRAKEIVDWVNGEIDSLLKRMAQLEGPTPSIYVEAGTYGAGKYGNTFGSNPQKQRMNWGSMLAQLRCQNVAEDISGPFGMGVIQPEQLLKRNPDLIVITGACWTAFPESLHLGYGAEPDQARDCLKQFPTRPGWPELHAVETGNIHGLNTRLGAHLMSFAAAEQLLQWLYPSQFHEWKPRQRLQEFHERFMPIEFGGTWMIDLNGP
jgi:iron complex transport system substrate-binding protein